MRRYQAEDAFVTPSGIQFYGNFYSCQRALREQWFYRAILAGEWSIPVLYSVTNRTQLLLSEHDLEVCEIVQFQVYDEVKRNQYYELIEIYKKSKQKLTGFKRGKRNEYL